MYVAYNATYITCHMLTRHYHNFRLKSIADGHSIFNCIKCNVIMKEVSATNKIVQDKVKIFPDFVRIWALKLESISKFKYCTGHNRVVWNVIDRIRIESDSKGIHISRYPQICKFLDISHDITRSGTVFRHLTFRINIKWQLMS